VAIRRLIVFAATCVFAKQSLGPILCGLLPLTVARTVQVPQAPLLPKLRGHFAEFLLHGSLEHLRLLASPTCVGFRYGRIEHSHARLFLAASFENPWRCKHRARHPISPIIRYFPRTRLPRCIRTSNTRRFFCFRVPPHDQHTQHGTGILTRFPSPTPLGLGLGAG
jgi:hypothetical protein